MSQAVPVTICWRQGTWTEARHMDADVNLPILSIISTDEKTCSLAEVLITDSTAKATATETS